MFTRNKDGSYLSVIALRRGLRDLRSGAGLDAQGVRAESPRPDATADRRADDADPSRSRRRQGTVDALDVAASAGDLAA